MASAAREVCALTAGDYCDAAAVTTVATFARWPPVVPARA
jgi:hypothetical protein